MPDLGVVLVVVPPRVPLVVARLGFDGPHVAVDLEGARRVLPVQPILEGRVPVWRLGCDVDFLDVVVVDMAHFLWHH